MSPCRPAPARPVHRRHSRPNPTENVAAAQGVVPRQLEFRRNENIINSLQKTGVQVGLDCSSDPRVFYPGLRSSLIWIVLGSPGFRLESPFHPCWSSFDFLGFLRPNRDFSM